MYLAQRKHVMHDSAGQAGPEIEITSAMIEAGVRVLHASGRLQYEAEGLDQELGLEVVATALAAAS